MSDPRPVDPATEERIRELLLDSDPIREDEGLSPREVERLRETMLEEPGGSGAPTPRVLLAAAAGILLVVGGGWLFWFRDVPEKGAGAVTVEVSPVPTGTLRPGDLDERSAADGPAVPADGKEIREPAVAGLRSSTRVAELGDPSGGAPEATGTSEMPGKREAKAASQHREALGPGDEQGSTAEAVVAREIRFETEGGTRLIWIFEEEPSVESDKGVTS